MLPLALRHDADEDVGQLLSAPEEVDGKSIDVCGWFVTDMETCTLRRSPPDGLSTDVDSVIWAIPSQDVCVPVRAFKRPIAGWARVNGTFRAGQGFGHLGQSRYALVGGNRSQIGPLRVASARPLLAVSGHWHRVIGTSAVSRPNRHGVQSIPAPAPKTGRRSGASEAATTTAGSKVSLRAVSPDIDEPLEDLTPGRGACGRGHCFHRTAVRCWVA